MNFNKNKSNIGKKADYSKPLEIRNTEIMNTTISDLNSSYQLSCVAFSTWEGTMGVIDLEDNKMEVVVSSTASGASSSSFASSSGGFGSGASSFGSTTGGFGGAASKTTTAAKTTTTTMSAAKKQWPILRSCFQDNKSEPDCFFGSANGEVFRFSNLNKKLQPLFRCGGPIVGLRWCSKFNQLYAAALNEKIYIYQEGQVKIEKIQLEDRPINLVIADTILVTVTVKGLVYIISAGNQTPKPQKYTLNDLLNEVDWSNKKITAFDLCKTAKSNEFVLLLGDNTGNVYRFKITDGLYSGYLNTPKSPTTSPVTHIVAFEDCTFLYFAGLSVYMGTLEDTGYVQKLSFSKENDRMGIVAATPLTFITNEQDDDKVNKCLVCIGYNWQYGAGYALTARLPQPSFYIVYNPKKV